MNVVFKKLWYETKGTIEEGTINFVLLFYWKKQKTKNKISFIDSLLYLSTLCGWIFQCAFSRKLITWAKSVTLTILAKTASKNTIRQVKSTGKLLRALKGFPNFLFVCFHWKIIWYLCKVNKRVKNERVSNWTDVQSSCWGCTSFNVPPCLLPKKTGKSLL